MSIEYQIGDTLYRVHVDGPPDGMQNVTLTPIVEDGEQAEPVTLQVQLTQVTSGTYAASIDGRQRIAHVAAGPESTFVQVQGQIFEVIPPEQLEQRRRSGGSADAHNHVTPPMPGQVIQILVEVGDVVAEGQGVIVISAMKMETTLSAPYAGTVTAINTAEGAQVNPGDVLVDIAAEE